MIDMGSAHQHRRHQRQDLRPGDAAPTRRPRRTVASTTGPTPKRPINAPAANRPASATNDSTSKTTANRSKLCDTPLTGSAFRSGPKAPFNYGYSPRSERHFRAFTPPNTPTRRWIQAKSYWCAFNAAFLKLVCHGASRVVQMRTMRSGRARSATSGASAASTS